MLSEPSTRNNRRKTSWARSGTSAVLRRRTDRKRRRRFPYRAAMFATKLRLSGTLTPNPTQVEFGLGIRALSMEKRVYPSPALPSFGQGGTAVARSPLRREAVTMALAGWRPYPSRRTKVGPEGALSNPPQYSTALEIRFSDWPALRREAVLAPIFRQMPTLHRLFPGRGFEPRCVVARPPEWRVHVVSDSFVVDLQQP